MKQKYYISIILILAVVISGIYFYTNQSTDKDDIRTYPQTSNFDFYSIHKIKQNKLPSGNYSTEGYVVAIYTCSPCPEGIFCKTCLGDMIIISETNRDLQSSADITDRELKIDFDSSNPPDVELGKKYKFTIKLTDLGYTDEYIYQAKLVEYDLIR